MIHQPPAGARDLLPLEVAQKRWIAENLQQVFHRWGYQRIITSTIEWLDTLTAGGAIQPSEVIKIQGGSEGPLGLRPELTASIARAAVTRMEQDTFPQRLYYSANVFRRSSVNSHGRQQEFYQAGIELLGAGGVLADAETLLLIADCFHQLGLQRWHLIIGEAELTQGLLTAFPHPLREQVRRCLANLDRISLENLPLSPRLRERALLLFDLRGQPGDVLQKVASLELSESSRKIVNNLKSLVDLLQKSCSVSLPLTLDLSLIHTFQYYTGIVFEVVSDREDSSEAILGRGGRYDKLLGLYHPLGKDSPGIGFSLDIEELHQELLSSAHLPQKIPAIDWLVIPENSQVEAEAFIYAQKLRNSQHLVRVEVDLCRHSWKEVRDYARKRGINHLAMIRENGQPVIEKL